ncbi:MAG: hypothetical protein COU47_00230 [Candidatus Niyogibacteria bacterium CG10_big_fil_rev_8_21_14_0_10_46_36]|uniref:Uncharacterized protein n=1 Tax=Candidatus Niyogibacteria bacterium CG10_big_fil_rev_8_21_14_0_10_46_36 TaxID=1974726 RepID=A0A2H0TE81_9BACT|nr:MAG: hypothetical protein COU47_00230 [Candidatus Niyogibacteria bacterium CG10_big_fil_rev_8_21_14_0_10_46_36]
MATNSSKHHHRKGLIRGRIQVFNPRNKRWTKIDTETHEFIDQYSRRWKAFKSIKKVGKKV